MLHCNTKKADFATILSTSRHCSVVFSEQSKSLSSLQKETIVSIVKEQAYLFKQLNSVEIGIELFIRSGLFSTILFRKLDNDVIEVLL